MQKEFNDISADDRPDKLSTAEFSQACQRIAQDYFGHVTQNNASPQLLYVTGLPGAGKSTFVEQERDARPELQDAVLINFDDLRIYHPRYDEYVAQDPINAAARIDRAVEDMIGWLCDEAAERSVHVILDDAAMGEEMTGIVLAPYKKQDYQIDAVVMAVPSLIARQSVLLRFEEDYAAVKSGKDALPRWVNTQEQDNAPNALLETTKVLETDTNLNSLKIVDRTGAQLSALQQPSMVVKMEMKRDLSKAEQSVYAEHQKTIQNLSQKRRGATHFVRRNGK